MPSEPSTEPDAPFIGAVETEATGPRVDDTSGGGAPHDAVDQLRVWGSNLVHVLPEPPARVWTVGAAEDSDLRLDDPTGCVSRTHAVLFREGRRWYLRDRDSTNGIWVDGIRCSEVALVPGAEVQIGRVTLVAESPRWVALRALVQRLLGWAEPQLDAVDQALHALRLGMTRRVPVTLSGAGNLVQVAQALHRHLLGPDRPFIVCDPRRRRVPATVRSAANVETGMLAVDAAAGGTLCLTSRRMPADFRAVVAAIREPQTRVRLVFCVQEPEDAERFSILPIAVPALVDRTDELERLIELYVEEASAALGVPRVALAPRDLLWLRREAGDALPDLEKATRRVVALRAFGSVARASARLGMAPVSLQRWMTRRGLEALGPSAKPAGADTPAVSAATRRPVTPTSVAAVIHRYPSEKESILGVLRHTRGETFVESVLAACDCDAGAAPQEESFES